MLNKVRNKISRFFFPSAEASRWVKLLPYLVLGVLTLLVLTASAYAWDYTNSPPFCGETCHTMPPEYTAYLTSPHARIDCVECHIGKSFIATRITRKAGDVKHVIATTFKTYEFPIRAHDLRPARETCELCHSPQKFSDDSLREIKHFGNDRNNTPTSIYLVLKTGGGSKREGLGLGIHWHIENQVQYLATDPVEQQIPYVRVIEDDGSVKEYVDLSTGFDPTTINPADLEEMDCITCHNRITHMIYPPQETVDQLMERGLISASIPDIRRLSVDAYSALYDTVDKGLVGIAAIESYYQTYYPDFYAENSELIQTAIASLQNAYRNSVYPEQKANWNSHPSNIGHERSPGCFRCHDGKHLNQDQEAIRLECNLCHSIPVVSQTSDFVANIEISRGPEPQSHLNSNWISMHHQALDQTCASCHTTDDPGGTSNSSFCSNSACHGSAWEYAGFNAPELREVILSQLPPTPTPQPVPSEGPLTYISVIQPILAARCGNCHGEAALQGLNLLTYESAMQGSLTGPVIEPGNPAGSRIIQVQSSDQPHFSQLNPEELQLVSDWIAAGAPQE